MNPDSMGRLTALMTRPYRYLRLEWSAELRALRVRTYVKPIQCYSLAGLTEMQRVLDDIAESPGLVRHLVLRQFACVAPVAQRHDAVRAGLDFPEPVGVLRIAFFSANNSRIASSCAG